MITQPWPKNPLIYEINAWTCLHKLRRNYDDPAMTLATVPDAELDAVAEWGFDAIWLMGIWQRSAAGRQIAREYPDLQADYHAALPISRRRCDRFAMPCAPIPSVTFWRAFLPSPATGSRPADARFVPHHVAVDMPC
jgi:hypothetical protein